MRKRQKKLSVRDGKREIKRDKGKKIKKTKRREGRR